MSEPDKRHWWQKKTNYGIACSIIGAAIVLTPGAPVVFAIGAIQITTSMLGVLLTGLGSALGSYGAAKRADNNVK